MISLNPLFYYQKTSDQTTYTQQPTGEIEVEKFLQGDSACWKTIGKVETYKKTIIFAHWFFQHLPRLEKSELFDALGTLSKAGFEFYFPSGEVLERINPFKTDLKKFEDKIKFGERSESFQSEEIKALCKKKLNKPSDEVLIFDDIFWQKQIQKKEVLSLSINTLAKLESSETYKSKYSSFREYFKETFHKYKFFTFDTLSKCTYLFYDNYKGDITFTIDKIYEAETSCDLYFELTQKQFTHFSTESFSLRHLEINKVDEAGSIQKQLSFISKCDLSQLETLKIKDGLEQPQWLSILLNKAPHLRYLSLSYLSMDFDVNPLTANLTGLKEIELIINKFSNQSLEKLLKSSPNLEKITIHTAEDLAADTFNSLRLDACRHLEYSTILPIDDEAMYQILSSMPNLEYLKIRMHGKKSIKPSIKMDLPLNQLKTLDLQLVKCSMLPYSLMATARGIKSVSINILNMGDHVKIPELPNLRKLSILKDVKPNVLKLFLSNTPALKSLSVRAQHYDFSGLGEGLLRNLLSTNIMHRTSVSKSFFGLHDLLKSAPQLKKITLDASKIDFANIRYLTLKHVRELCLQRLSHFSQVYQVLDVFPNIKILRLEDLQYYDPLPTTKQHHYGVEHLLLNGMHIHEAGLKRMLNVFNNLKLLSIEQSSIKYDATDIEPVPTLNQLEKLNLDDVNLQKGLWFTSSSLKTIQLDRVSIDKGFPLDRATLTHCESLKLTGLAPDGEADIKRIDVACIHALLQDMNHLKSLSFESCEVEESEGAQNLTIKALQCLRILKSRFPLSYFEAILNSAPYLTVLDLKDHDRLYGEAPLKLIKNKHLERIQVSVYMPEAIGFKLRRMAPQAQYCISYVNSKSESETETLESQFQVDDEALDAQTSATDEVLTVRNIFKGIGVEDPSDLTYRIKPYNTFNIRKRLAVGESPFIIRSDFDEQCIKRVVIQRFSGPFFSGLQGTFYHGTHSLNVCDKWQPLPSLAIGEKLKFYHTKSDAPLSFGFNDNNQFYYVKSDDNRVHHLVLQFVIEPPDAPKPHSDLPTKIQAWIKRFNQFKPGDLSLKQPTTGLEVFRAMNEKMHGACRHRAFMFAHQVKQHFPEYHPQIISNDSHAFVEIRTPKGHWITCDLGGYPADVKYIDPPGQEDAFVNYLWPYLNTQQEETISEDCELRQYKDWFKTWNASDSKPPKLESLIHAILHSAPSSRLILLESTQSCLLLKNHILQSCQLNNERIFVVNDPRTLNIFAQQVRRTEDNLGLICSGPAGPLYDFIQKNLNNVSYLVLNYDNFSDAEIVQFNSLLDEEAHLQGIEIPKNMHIIGLLNKADPECYQGSDFYSRFDKVTVCPFKEEVLSETIRDVNPQPSTEVSDQVIIPMFSHLDWKSQLLGHWSIDQATLIFKPSMLEKCLESGSTRITLSGAPWNKHAFIDFWQQALIVGEIDFHGKIIKLPKSFELVQSPPLSYGHRLQALSDRAPEGGFWHAYKPRPGSNYFVLNPATLQQFINQYHIQAGYIRPSPGHLEEHADQTLNLYLTRNLIDSQWHALLDAAEKYNVTLRIYAPGIIISSFTASTLLKPQKKLQLLNNIQDLNPVQVIQTNDIDATCAYIIKAQQQPWLVLDVSECQSTDLMLSTEADFVAGQFRFKQSAQALFTALERKQPVVLKGHFSQSLADHLAFFILKDTQFPTKQILLITEDASPLSYCEVIHHQVDAQLKKTLIRTALELDWEMPFVQIQSLVRHQLSHHQAKRLWAGLYRIESPYQRLAHISEVSDFVTQSETLTQSRVEAVMRVLQKAPFVFIAGLTGVGKSTFIKKAFMDHVNCIYLPGSGGHLYHGMSAISEWISDETPKMKFLFIDEANLSHRQFSEFEGLFNKAPGILLDGTYHKLSSNHKVIFAGNPLSYGDDRDVAPLFRRHGNTVIFEPLNDAFIIKHVLMPVFDRIKIETSTLMDWFKHLLEIYHFICNKAQHEIYISPRELQMMALLILNNIIRQQPPSPEQIAFDVATSVLPETLQTEFNARFKPKILAQGKVSLGKSEDSAYFVTPSRLGACRALRQRLELHELRQRGLLNDDAQNYGGLGAITLEGESGIGKSELIRYILKEKGYRCASKAPNAPKSYVSLPISWSMAQKKEALLKAFNEGKVVVMDEINSSPMMEPLLNALLMGEDLEGHRPLKPGFMLIGTQNPITMTGRRVCSQALQRRMTTLEIKSYTQSEMIDILQAQHPSLNLKCAEKIIQAYETQRVYGLKHDLTPIPNFRDVLRVTQKVVQKMDEDSSMQKAEIEHDPLAAFALFADFSEQGFEKHSKEQAQPKPGY